MTNEALRMLAEIQKALRNTAERDPNDIIANAASDLAVRLEAVNTTFGMRLKDLTDLDRQIIKHAMKNHTQARIAA
jgi:hypothetical protein